MAAYQSFSRAYAEPVSELSLKSLLDNAPDAVARFDRQLRHVYVNAATAVANGRPASDFPGKTMRDLGHTEQISNLIETNLRAVFHKGREVTFDVEFEGPQGVKLFQCRMAPERNQSGAVEYVIVFSRDITLQREA